MVTRMRYLLVSRSSKENSRRVRWYLGRGTDPVMTTDRGWNYTCQRDEAAEFETHEEAQRTIETTRTPENWCVVSVSEDKEYRRVARA
jgi:hypothetical protein